MGIELATALAIGGLAASGAGAYKQYEGAKAQSEASQRAEAARKQQMNLETDRKQREILRQSQLARSIALTRGTEQGANEAGGSAIPGAYGQISGQETQNRTGVFQAVDIGNSIFQANREFAQAQELSAFGSGLSKLGGALYSNATDISNIGSSLYGRTKSLFEGLY